MESQDVYKRQGHPVSGRIRLTSYALFRLALAAAPDLKSLTLPVTFTRQMCIRDRAQILGIVLQQGAGNAVTDGAGLAGHAAAGNAADDVELLVIVGEHQLSLIHI